MKERWKDVLSIYRKNTYFFKKVEKRRDISGSSVVCLTFRALCKTEKTM